MTRLLASVRDPCEAAVALRGGADWIDIKDPRAGALGAAPDDVIREIVSSVDRRCPVSATIGDSWDAPDLIERQVARFTRLNLDYIKVGVRASAMPSELTDTLHDACAQGTAVIAVCMAEDPPDATDLVALAATGVAGAMLDTADKAGPRLAALHDRARLGEFVRAARGLGLLTGLAGSLRVVDIPEVFAAGPDYLGFRGALCAGRRTDAICADAVRQVREAFDQTRGRQRVEQVEVA